MAAARSVNAAIAASGSLSGAVDTGVDHVVGLVMPAAWTTAALTFSVSHDGETYQALYDDAGTEVTIASANAAAARTLCFSASMQLALLPWRYLKVRSGTSGSPVTQAAARAVGLVLLPAA